MSPPEMLRFGWWVLVIELAGGVIIAGYVVAALVTLLRGRGIDPARRLVSDGALLGLTFVLAATLVQTIELRTWNQILIFSCVLGLRVVLKTVFSRERSRPTHAGH